MPKHITDESFNADVLRAEKPVLVDFWAEWCGPCKQLTPVLENPMTPSKYGVRGIPTLMLFKDGQVAATRIGAMARGKLFEWVESVL